MIGFRLGDLWTDIFTYLQGKNAGNQGVSLKARLLFVSWIKVDGKLVHKAEPKPTETDERTPEVPVTTDVPLRSKPRRNLPRPPTMLLTTTLPMLPHWPLPSRSDPPGQGPLPGPCLLIVSRRPSRSPSRPTGHQDHPRPQRRLQRRPPRDLHRRVRREERRLDQYAEGKYEGDFAIAEIRPSTYNANGRMVIEIRALLGGMTLSAIDA